MVEVAVGHVIVGFHVLAVPGQLGTGTNTRGNATQQHDFGQRTGIIKVRLRPIVIVGLNGPGAILRNAPSNAPSISEGSLWPGQPPAWQFPEKYAEFLRGSCASYYFYFRNR